MNPVAIILIASVIVTTMLNIFACYRVIKSDQLEPLQKTLQCILIWLIPVLGAGLCIALTREPKRGEFSGKYSSKQTLGSYDIDDLNISQSYGDYFQD